MPKQSYLLTAVPPWFVRGNNSAGRECSPCMCKEDFRDVICDEELQESYLLLGYCMTYNSSSSDEQASDAISLVDVLMFTTAII